MYYGALGAGRPSRPSESTTSERDARNPYEKIETQMGYRIDAIRNWATYCVQVSRDLYLTMSRRNQTQTASSQSGVVEQIENAFIQMIDGVWAQKLHDENVGFILTTLSARESQDPVLVEKARTYLNCYQNMVRSLQNHLRSMRVTVNNTIEQGSALSNTVGAIKGLRDGCVSISGNCDTTPAFAPYNNILQQKKAEWEQQRAQALQDQADAEAYAEAMRRQAERMAQAAAEASARAAQQASERQQAEAAAAAAQAAAQADYAERFAAYQARQAAEAAAEQQAATEAAATEAAAAEAAATEAAAAAEDQARESAEIVEEMDAEADSMDEPKGEFPWLLVGLGGFAVVGIGAAVYFSQKG